MIIPNSNESSRLRHVLRYKFGISLRSVSVIITGDSPGLQTVALSHGGRQLMKSANYRVVHLWIYGGVLSFFPLSKITLGLWVNLIPENQGT